MSAERGNGRFGATTADAMFVWLVWAGMLAAAVWFVARWAVNAPNMDDLDYARVLQGEEPLTWGWYWEQRQEHRLPLAKALIVSLYALTSDFRSGMYFSVGCCGVASAALILAARRARGWTAYADAFFPLTLLHWGFGETWLWGFGCIPIMICMTVTTVLLSVLASRQRPGPVACLAVGAGLAALPLGGGGAGAALVPCLALWLFAYGLGNRATRAIALASAALAAAVLAVYVSAFTGPPDDRYAGLWPTAQVAGELVALMFGPIINEAGWERWAAVALALVALAVGLTARAALCSPGERWRGSAILACVGSLLCLAATVAIGRAHVGTSIGFSPRYAVLMAPLACASYLSVVIFLRGRFGHWLQVGLLLFAGVMTWVNADRGLFRTRALQSRPPVNVRWN